jgi:hypothetical protein
VSTLLVVRPIRAGEINLVLAAWKNQLFHTRDRARWSLKLPIDYFWMLINHVIDKITIPSSLVFVGCHESELETPICWAVVRRIDRGTYEVLYTDARESIHDSPQLSATLERELLSQIHAKRPLAQNCRTYNPFLELKR